MAVWLEGTETGRAPAGRRPGLPLFAPRITDSAFPSRGLDLFGQAGPYLRHLQHDRFGLRIRRSPRNLQASRRKYAVFFCPPHAAEPCRRLHRERDRGRQRSTKNEFHECDEAFAGSEAAVLAALAGSAR